MLDLVNVTPSGDLRFALVETGQTANAMPLAALAELQSEYPDDGISYEVITSGSVDKVDTLTVTVIDSCGAVQTRSYGFDVPETVGGV
jgi:hypothetical protein